ncbi:hypothetical protein [Paenibacillus abyssi]|uniref:Uncharacterized protein n=1 Tax=Paenibacillus abyssi TaxID=1340531 RepID=A0A917LGK9_9BACL|nr:hypothetical protein [Paenibacillus abyssi]GGG21561.1 hypothetical protein GCM10010916_42840 [Paenibacillus abyssi]
MQMSDQYYCVGCGRLEQANQAKLLFRTGFFRVIHPIGCCVSCSEKKAESDRLPSPPINEQLRHGSYSPGSGEAIGEKLDSGNMNKQYAVMT